MKYGLFHNDKLLFEDDDRSVVVEEGFHRKAWLFERGKTRLQPGWKVREVKDGESPVQVRDEGSGHHQEYVRSEEGGRIGRVVQRSPKDHSNDPQHKGYGLVHSVLKRNP